MSMTAFFEEELVKIIGEVERVEYGRKTARMLLPFDAKASRGSQALKQYVLDRAGYMRLKEKVSDKVELVDIAKTAVYLPLLISENGFQYDIDEIAAAQEGGTSLDAEKASAVLEAYEEMVNRVAFVGQADLGLTGLANNANVSIDNAPTTFALMTSEQRVVFFAGLAGLVYTGSGNTIKADTLVIPSAEYVAMGEKTYSNTGVVTDKSELEMLQTRLDGMYGTGFVIESALELEAQGAAGVQRAAAYAKNPRVLYFEETLPLEYQPVQRINNVFKVPTFAKVGGVFVRRPYGIYYGDYAKV